MSMEHVHAEREPFVRMVKRDGISTKKAWLIRGCAIVCALIVCALLIFFITKLKSSAGATFFFILRSPDSLSNGSDTATVAV